MASKTVRVLRGVAFGFGIFLVVAGLTQLALAGRLYFHGPNLLDVPVAMSGKDMALTFTGDQNDDLGVFLNIELPAKPKDNDFEWYCGLNGHPQGAYCEDLERIAIRWSMTDTNTGRPVKLAPQGIHEYNIGLKELEYCVGTIKIEDGHNYALRASFRSPDPAFAKLKAHLFVTEGWKHLADFVGALMALACAFVVLVFGIPLVLIFRPRRDST